jgi:hypothetical protein
MAPIPQRANPALTTSLYWPPLPQRAYPAVTMHWPPIPQRANPAVTTATLHWPPLQQRANPAVTTAILHCLPIPLPATPVISPALNFYTELDKLENILKYKFTNKLVLLQVVIHPSSVSTLDKSNDKLEYLGINSWLI